MFRAQQAAKRAVAGGGGGGRFMSLQDANRWTVLGKRRRRGIARWKSDQAAIAGGTCSTLDLESVLTYEPSTALFSSLVSPPLASPPRFRSIHTANHQSGSSRIRQQQQHSNDEALRHFYDTLRAYSTAMPNKLIKVNEEASHAPPRSWREAAVFQGYRDGTGSRWSMAANSAAATVEPYMEDGDEDEDWEETAEEEEEFDLYEELPSAIHPEESIEQNEESFEQEEEGVAPQKEEIQMMVQAEVEYRDELPAPAGGEKYLENVKPIAAEESGVALNQLDLQLMEAMKRNHLDRAIQIFEAATVAKDVEPSMNVVYELFRRLSYQHPFHAYQLMQYILKRNNCVIGPQAARDQEEGEERGLVDENLVWLYSRMCISLRTLDPAKSRHGDIRFLVGSVTSEINQLSLPIQQRCVPELLTSLAMQKSSAIGRWASHYYHRIVNTWELELPPRYFQHLLAYSRYHRRDELPFHDVLRRTVHGGLRPQPHIVIGAVENMFPYTRNVKSTYIALESVVQLQTQTQQLIKEREEEMSRISKQMEELDSNNKNKNGDDIVGNNNSDEKELLKELQRRLHNLRQQQQDSHHHSYIMDVTALEYMADAAAKKNFVDLILLVWDALDVMGLEPSEAIYENTILCFATIPDMVENSFVVLSDMEEKFTVSLPFFRSIARALRKSSPTLAKADQIVVESFRNGSPDSIKWTPAVLTSLMAAHAWTGHVAGCMDLLDAFSDRGWSPDADCLGFALESVGKAARRLKKRNFHSIHPNRKEDMIESYLGTAETILGQLEEARDSNGNPLVPSSHFIHQYVEFLCTVGYVRTAGLVAQDFMEQDGSLGQLVSNETLQRIAFAHRENGDFDMARQFVASTSEIRPFLKAAIDAKEHFYNNPPPNELSSDLESHAPVDEAGSLVDEGPSEPL